MNFKESLRRDIEQTFHNVEEFAEETAVRYDGTWYNIPIILDHSEAKDRRKPSTDHADGIFLCDAVVYIKETSLPIVPRKDRNIEIGEELYKIVKTGNEAGEIVLHLEMLDE